MRSRSQEIARLDGRTVVSELERREGTRSTGGRQAGLAGGLALLLLVIAPLGCTSGDLPTSPGDELSTVSTGGTGGALGLAQCADASPPKGESVKQGECSGGGAGTYACQAGMSCRNYTVTPNLRLGREPDEISCSTATRLCTAVYYGGGSTTFNPEEQGFLFGSSCFAACGNAALTRSPFTTGACLVCAGIYARHYDLVADATRVNYILGMHGMNRKVSG